MDVSCLEHMLICRLPHVKAVFKDVILRHGIDQVGYIPVGVYVFPDTGGAYVLKVFFQMKVDDIACDRIRLFSGQTVPALIGTALEYYMVHRMDRVRCRRLPVT